MPTFIFNNTVLIQLRSGNKINCYNLFTNLLKRLFFFSLVLQKWVFYIQLQLSLSLVLDMLGFIFSSTERSLWWREESTGLRAVELASSSQLSQTHETPHTGDSLSLCFHIWKFRIPTYFILQNCGEHNKWV